MNTLENSKNEPSKGRKARTTGTEEEVIQQFGIVLDFFLTDSSAEISE